MSDYSNNLNTVSSPKGFKVGVSYLLKRFGGAKVISTVLGMLLLAGGVGAGVVLVMEPQLLEQHAQTVDYPCKLGEVQTIPAYGSFPTCVKSCVPGSNGLNEWSACIVPGGLNTNCFANEQCVNGYYCNLNTYTCQGNPTTTTCNRNIDPGAPVCCTSATSVSSCEAAGGVVSCEFPHRLECTINKVWCVLDAESYYCGGGSHLVIVPTPTPTPTPVLTPTPTPPTTGTIITPAPGSTPTPPGTTVTPPTPTPVPPVIAPTQITPISNISCAITNPTLVTFKWTAVAGASSYYLRLDDTSNAFVTCGTGTPNPGDFCLPNITGTSFNLSLPINKSYKWWVSAMSGSGVQGPVSTTLSFSIGGYCGTPSPTPVGDFTPTPTPTVLPSLPPCYMSTPTPPSGTLPPGYTPTPVATSRPCYTPVASPSPIPTVSPTPSPSPMAVCTGATIYTPNWTFLSAADFYNLPAGGQVYFCVNGATNVSAGFDMARFTINGVLRPTVTLQRPSSTDFCDLYTIPANTYSVNVQAEIHSPVLGWQ